MRKFLVTVSLLAVPAFVIRALDLWFLTDRNTGFVEAGGPYYIRIAIGAAVLVVGGFTLMAARRWLRASGADFESTNGTLERSAPGAGICLFIAAFATVAASIGQLYRMITSGELAMLLGPAEAITDPNERLYLWLFLVSAVLGLFVAFWLLLTGAWFFRGEGHFAGGRYISILVIVWYCARVIMDFVQHPVNPKNINALVQIFGLLLLTLFYMKLAKVVSIDFPVREEPMLFTFGVMAYIWVVGFGAPTALVFVEGGALTDLLSLAADVFAAVAALAVLFARLPEKEREPTPQA